LFEWLVSLAGLCVLARFALVPESDSSDGPSVETTSVLLRFSRREGVGGDGVDADKKDAPSPLDISRVGVSVGRSSLAFLRGEEGLVMDFRLAMIPIGKVME
jgi:hypothetical protein